MLLGRLAYTPRYAEVDREGEGEMAGGGEPQPLASPSSAVGAPAVLGSPSTAAAGGGGASSSTFFVPKSVEDPKERLQRLLIEKERGDTQEGQGGGLGEGLTISIPHSASSPLTYAVALPAALPPKRLSVVPPPSSQPRTASPREGLLPAASSPSSAPAMRVVSSVSPPLAPVGPSLFDASPAAAGGQRSAQALLSSLLGGEKKSVFYDD